MMCKNRGLLPPFSWRGIKKINKNNIEKPKETIEKPFCTI
jgi:hypothetical protein